MRSRPVILWKDRKNSARISKKKNSEILSAEKAEKSYCINKISTATSHHPEKRAHPSPPTPPPQERSRKIRYCWRGTTEIQLVIFSRISYNQSQTLDGSLQLTSITSWWWKFSERISDVSPGGRGDKSTQWSVSLSEGWLQINHNVFSQETERYFPLIN